MRNTDVERCVAAADGYL